MGTYYEDGTAEQRAPYGEMVRDALAMPDSDKRRRELGRLCRTGAYRPQPSDWPEFSDADWRDGVFCLRGRARDFVVGQHICAGRENFARVFEILSIAERHVEPEDWEDTGKMVWRTNIHVKAVAIDGDYAVLPGDEPEDIADRIIWSRSLAEDTIRRIGLQ